MALPTPGGGVGIGASKSTLLKALGRLLRPRSGRVLLDGRDLRSWRSRHAARELAGRTVVAVLHDLNQAVRYADHLVVMRDGQIIAQGDPTDAVTAETVAQVFGLRAVVVQDSVTGDPMVVPSAHWLQRMS